MTPKNAATGENRAEARAGDCDDATTRKASESNPVHSFPLAVAGIRLDPCSPLPIHEQICQALRRAVWAHELPPNTLLPTSRELAQHLGVARNTVVFAYTRLVSEGICVSNTRRGTRISSDLPVRPDVLNLSRKPEHPPVLALLRPAFLARNALENRVDRLPNGIPFALNVSDPALYPRTKLGRRLADKYLGVPRLSSHLRSVEESGKLQDALVAYLRQFRGIACVPSQIVVVSGLEAALALTARVLLDPGDTVKISDPAMDVARSAFASARAVLWPVPCEAHGATSAQLEGPPARLIYFSPSVTFPFGAQVPESRRREILALARAEHAVVFENDVYCDLRYSGTRLRTLQGMDTEGRVIYYGSFLEALGDSVNVGYLVVPLSLREAFVEVQRRLANTPPPQFQDALADFIADHDFAAHVRNVRSVFAKRLDLVKQSCKAHLPEYVSSQPDGGLFVVLHFDSRIDDTAVCEIAAEEGLPVRPLSHCYLARGAHRGAVIGFGALPERAISPTIEKLSNILARCAPQRLSA